jgi:hypothetical protein
LRKAAAEQQSNLRLDDVLMLTKCTWARELSFGQSAGSPTLRPFSVILLARLLRLANGTLAPAASRLNGPPAQTALPLHYHGGREPSASPALPSSSPA